MIARLHGRIAALDDSWAVIDCGGVGYEVFCHLRTLASLHEHQSAGRDVTLHIHTGVSDDAIRLYGFNTVDELRLFRLLLGVERIGPKAALGILGRAELATLVKAIRAGDVALVTTVPGVGRKTAERVILELRDKLDGLAMPGDAQAGTVTEHHAVTAAIEGLRGLGFRESEARSAVSAAMAQLPGEPDVGALVSEALRRLDMAAAS
ncbi:MAG TPA: Holliday junction branch migration protein RuvA [Candidatus Dormibacteraeota bacterium]|nr:Holliday junction branch migration protein RuvA [Candidatus Dormibacteraeota bacterium]